MSSRTIIKVMIAFYIFIFFGYLFGPLLVMSATAFNTPSYPAAYPFEGFTRAELEIEIELVAARHRVGEVKPAQRRLLQPELEGAAGLEHNPDVTRLQRTDTLGRIKQKLLADRERAHAVRTGNPKAIFRQRAQRLCA